MSPRASTAACARRHVVHSVARGSRPSALNPSTVARWTCHRRSGLARRQRGVGDAAAAACARGVRAPRSVGVSVAPGALRAARRGAAGLGGADRPPALHRRAALRRAGSPGLSGPTAAAAASGVDAAAAVPRARAGSRSGPTEGRRLALDPAHARHRRAHRDQRSRCATRACPRAVVDSAAGDADRRGASADHRGRAAPPGPPRRPQPLDRGPASQRQGASSVERWPRRRPGRGPFPKQSSRAWCPGRPCFRSPGSTPSSGTPTAAGSRRPTSGSTTSRWR